MTRSSGLLRSFAALAALTYFCLWGVSPLAGGRDSETAKVRAGELENQ